MDRTTQLAPRGRLQALLGGTALVVATALMVERVEPVATWFYCFAWWSYILCIDGLVHAREGRSLLRTTPRNALALAVHSVTFWLLFEAYNLRVRNWYYVGAPDDFAARVAGSVIAFATVLPGIFETADLLSSLFPRRGSAPAPRPSTPAWGLAMALLGAVLSVLPLLLPRYLFPLLWLGPTLLFYGIDAPTPGSLHGRLTSGDRRPVALLVGAGLVMGGLWEALNQLARAKWIYTVPFFEGSKLFEMPIPGFLGYPPFAVEAYLFVRVVGWRAGTGALWDFGPIASPRPLHRRRLAIAAGLSLALWALVIPALDRETIWSTTPLLTNAAWLAPDRSEKLDALGVRTTEDLVRRSVRRDPAVEEALGPDQGRALDHAALATLKGIGLTGEELLGATGIDSVERLAEADPERLTQELEVVGRETGVRPPRLAQVKVWVAAARRDVRP